MTGETKETCRWTWRVMIGWRRGCTGTKTPAICREDRPDSCPDCDREIEEADDD